MVLLVTFVVDFQFSFDPGTVSNDSRCRNVHCSGDVEDDLSPGIGDFRSDGIAQNLSNGPHETFVDDGIVLSTNLKSAVLLSSELNRLSETNGIIQVSDVAGRS